MSCALPEKATRIAIVGAGIGGLMLAASLGEDYQIDLFDHRSSLNGDGYGLNIQPIAVTELAGLGLLSRLCSLGIQTRAHRYLSSDGQQIMEEPRGRFAGEEMPQLSILRHDLVSILLAQLPGSCRIHTSATITIEDLERWDRQSPAPYDLIVGADGINSVTRTYTVGATALHDGGMTLYRGVADLPKMLDGETFILVTADDGCRLIAYPVSAPIARSGSSRINWVLLVPDRVYEGQTPVLGESQEAVRRILGSLIGNWALDFLDIEAMIEKSPTIKSDRLGDRDPINQWSRSRVVLLGDAAHPMYPIGAQGASQTIVDAACLAGAIKTEADPFIAIAEFVSARLPQTNNVVLANRKMNREELEHVGTASSTRSEKFRTTTSNYRQAVRDRTRPHSSSVGHNTIER